MNRRIKVLFIDHTPFIGGAQLWQSTVAKSLDKSLFRSFAVTGDNVEFSKIYRAPSLKSFRINFPQLKTLNLANWLKLPTSVKQLQQIISQVKPDIVITNTTRGLILAFLTRGDFKLIPYILDYKYPKWLLLLIQYRIEKYLCVSKSIQNFYHLPQDKAVVVYLGSNLKLQKQSNSQIRKPVGIKRGDFVIGFVGRLVKDKGAETVIHALGKISSPHVKLLIFGTGVNQQGSVEKEIKALIQKYNLKNRVNLMGFQKDRTAIFEAFDVFVMPTLKPEPFASTLIEAAMIQVPIIASLTGGTPEFIRHNENGLLFSPGNYAQLARFLVRLNKDRNLRNKLAKQAYQDVQKFSAEKIIKRIEEVLIEGRPST